MIKSYSIRLSIIFSLSLLVTLSSCKKDTPMPEQPPVQPKAGSIDYSKFTYETPYNNDLFVNSGRDSIIDRTEGHLRLQMLKAMDAYMKTVNGTGTVALSTQKLEDMFAGKGFSDEFGYLNNTGVDLRSVTGSSRQYFAAELIRGYFSKNYSDLAIASQSAAQVAEKRKAGKLATQNTAYMVDEKGIEIGQVIAKSFMGAFQLDFIGNVLLDKGLNDDNDSLVKGKKYTKLGHNWDVAYGILTTKPIYGAGATGPEVVTGATHNKEAFLGQYLWEYNRENFKNVHLAFLKGRAAVINKDEMTMNQQAIYIRKQLEFTIAMAALGYLNKWRIGNADQNIAEGVKAHAIAEGLGFIYSLRFCNLNGANDTFSDQILKDLIESPDGYWDITLDKIVKAETAIKAQFSIK